MTKRFLGVLAVGLFLVPLMVQAAETEGERLARMLAAFDRGNVIPGVLLVSFERDTTKSSAEAVLREFGLAIRTTRVCSAEANPGGEVKPGPCTTVDEWNESLSIATVKVAEGEEKEFAEDLYAHQAIVWVEPDYTVSITAGENPGEGDVLPGGEMEEGVGNSEDESLATSSSNQGLLAAVIVALVILGLVVAYTKKKA